MYTAKINSCLHKSCQKKDKLQTTIVEDNLVIWKSMNFNKWNK